jgi:hypothetical protein
MQVNAGIFHLLTDSAKFCSCRLLAGADVLAANEIRGVST